MTKKKKENEMKKKQCNFARWFSKERRDECPKSEVQPLEKTRYTDGYVKEITKEVIEKVKV